MAKKTGSSKKGIGKAQLEEEPEIDNTPETKPEEETKPDPYLPKEKPSDGFIPVKYFCKTDRGLDFPVINEKTGKYESHVSKTFKHGILVAKTSAEVKMIESHHLFNRYFFRVGDPNIPKRVGDLQAAHKAAQEYMTGAASTASAKGAIKPEIE